VHTWPPENAKMKAHARTDQTISTPSSANTEEVQPAVVTGPRSAMPGILRAVMTRPDAPASDRRTWTTMGSEHLDVL